MHAGESVGIIVADEFFNKRGEIITLSDDKPSISNRLRASVFWLGKNSLTTGKKYKLKLATAEVEATVEKIIRTVDASTLENREDSSSLKLNDVGEIIFKLKNKIAFDKFSDFQATGRFVLVDNYDVAGGGIILQAENSEADGTVFSNGVLTFQAELFDEFYYDVDRRQITQVAETKNVIYQIGDEIPTTGFSFEYPDDFNIILLNESAFVKIRDKKVFEIGKLENYGFEKVPHVNGRGFGLKIKTAEDLDEIQEIFNGEIILVAQDARLMQIEINKRRRLTDWTEKNSSWNDDTLQIERTIQSRFTGMDGEGI